MQRFQLRMENASAPDLPAPPLPDGYLLRNFRRGDESQLAAIYAECGFGASSAVGVSAVVLQDPRFSSGRMFNLEHKGSVVGTVLAWCELDDPGHGYIHMLGVLPEHRGKGLGRALALTAIARSAREGYHVHRLFTDDHRVEAIRLYHDLNYVPLVVHESHWERWEALARQLDCEDLLAHAHTAELQRLSI